MENLGYAHTTHNYCQRCQKRGEKNYVQRIQLDITVLIER